MRCARAAAQPPLHFTSLRTNHPPVLLVLLALCLPPCLCAVPRSSRVSRPPLQAKHEILIEQKVDKKKAAKKAAMTAAKAAASKAKLEQKKAAEKAATGKTEQTTKADIKKVQAAASLAKKHAVKHALKQGKVEGSNKLFHEVSKWAQGKGKKAKAAKK